MVGKSRLAKGLNEQIKSLNDDFLIQQKEVQDHLSELPILLAKTLVTLKEMKIGSEPNEDADYWEEKNMIDKHLLDIEDANLNVEAFITQFDEKKGQFDKASAEIKTIKEGNIEHAQRVVEKLEQNKELLDELLIQIFDIRDIYEQTKKEMDEC